jgi:two-component system nitrogen regulation response regulator NtrX
MIRAGTFREDLYFRLAVLPLHVPPLSERTEDIPILVTHFAEQLARRRGRRPKSFTPAALETLALRRWRGNVRELANLVERLVLMTPGEAVDLSDLPPEDEGLPAAGRDGNDLRPGQTLADAREAFERRAVAKVLLETKGNVSRAAERLGLDRTTLHRRLRTWGLEAGKE